MTGSRKDQSAEQDWLKWPIGMIGFVPPHTPITAELLSQKVEEARQVGADVLAFPCEVEGYAMWPTQIIPPVANAALPDVLGSLLEMAHDCGLKVLGHWMGVHCQSGFWKSHPQWLQRKPDGELIESLPGGGPWPAMCLNSPFGDCLLAQVEEVLTRYPVDGIYFDGLYQRFTGCYCKACSEIYTAHHGRPMPAETMDARMRRFREDTVCDFLARLRAVLDRCSPQTPFILDTVGPTLGWLRGEDIPRMATYADIFLLESYWEIRRQLIWTDGMEARLTRALSGLDVWSPKWLARNPDHEQVSVSEASVRTWMGQSLANACPPFPLEQNLFQVDASLIRLLAEVDEHSRLVGEYLAQSEPLAHVALLYPHQSLRSLSWRDREVVLEHFQGAYQALSERHTPFEPVTEEQIVAGRLAGMDACLLPNAECLSEDAVAALRHYCQDGGNLVLCYQTGLRDGSGVRRRSPALWDLAGVRPAGRFDAVGPRGIAGYGGQNSTLYCRIGEAHPIVDGMEARLTSFPGSALLLETEDDVTTVGDVLDYDEAAQQTDGFFTWYPGDALGPLITARQTEWGSRVAFVAADLPRACWLHGWPELSQLLARTVLWAAGVRGPYEVVSHHPQVEVRGYRCDADGSLIFVFSNLASNQMATVRGGGFPQDRGHLIRSHHVTDIVPQADVRLLVRGELCHGREARALISSKISTRVHGDDVEITVHRLGPYEVVALE